MNTADRQRERMYCLPQPGEWAPLHRPLGARVGGTSEHNMPDSTRGSKDEIGSASASAAHENHRSVFAKRKYNQPSSCFFVGKHSEQTPQPQKRRPSIRPYARTPP